MENILCTGILLLICSGLGDETYENSTNLCDKCNCLVGPTKFVLDCTSQGFHHMLANWPEHKTELIATFSYNNITNLEVLPSSDLVKQVVLSHCGIQTLDNGAFKGNKYMKFLDLSYNFLKTEEIGPEKFKGPYNDTVYEPLLIEHLDLSYNQIHSLPHKIFEHLITLEELNLEGNMLKVLDQPTQAALSRLTNLQVLNLANNELTELIEEAIQNLQKLRILNLAMNEFDFVPDTLPCLSNSLEEVYLDHNLIFELNDDTFLGVKGIKRLSLTNLPRLEYVNANSFTPLHNLSIIMLSDNPSLTTIDREAFGVNQTLEELYLHNNSLQDLHYNLTRWSSLRIFTLFNNDLICDCDLYKISQDLSDEVKTNKDGPYCINPVTDSSEMIYNLTEEACLYEHYVYRASHIIEHHFRTVKLTLLLLTLIFSLASLGAILIFFLKYRRYRMNRNYPFTTQVTYNHLRSPTD